MELYESFTNVITSRIKKTYLVLLSPLVRASEASPSLLPSMARRPQETSSRTHATLYGVLLLCGITVVVIVVVEIE